MKVEEKTLLYSQKKVAWPKVCLSLSSKETSLERLKHVMTSTQLGDVPCKDICQQPLQALTLHRTH